MAATTFATIGGALNTLLEPRVTSSINRAVVLAQILPVEGPRGKNISWDVKLGTATAGAVDDGATVSTYNADTKTPATLNYGIYSDPFSISGFSLTAAAESGPEQLADLFMDEAGDSLERLGQAIGKAVYDGDGGSSPAAIHGLHDSTVSPIGDSGIYAGIDRSTYTQWKGTVVSAAGATLSMPLLRELSRKIYIASGQRPNLYITDPTQHEKYAALFSQERRYVQEVRTSSGVIKLDGGYRVLEIDGVSFLEDVQHPAQKVTALNTNYVKVRHMPSGPNAINGGMGVAQLAPSAEEQLGERKMQITARINPLGRNGDAFRFQLVTYVQLQVKRPQTCGYISLLAA